MCENSAYVSFPPNKAITSQCEVVHDVGQEITLRVQFFSIFIFYKNFIIPYKSIR